jgi:hypothetical protein
MRLRPSLTLLAIGLAPSLASAQPSLSVDLAAANGYVWRGVTNVNQLVLDPALALELPLHRGTLTLGAWGNFEPRRSDGARDIGTLGGQHGPLLTQSQLYAEYGGARGALSITGGATTYLYPNVGELSSTYQTVELYASVSREGLLTPSLAVWQDVWKVRGTYLEAGLGQDVPVGHGHAVSLAAAMGVSAGMRERDGQAAYFAHDGVTHAEFSATTELARGAVAFEPTVHLVLARDPWARLAAPDVQRTAKVWAGVTFKWRRPLSRVAAAIVPVIRPVLLPPVYSDGADEVESADAARVDAPARTSLQAP